MSNATTYSLGGGGGSSVLSLTGNDLLLVAPDNTGNINLLGSGVLTVSGTAHTETISLTASTNGQLIIGAPGGAAWATLTAGAGISITNGANSISIAATGVSNNISFTTDDSSTITNTSFTLHGANGLTTSSAGSTLTVSLTNPVSIAHGGTNATSMTTTDGVVYFDGTRLVTTLVGTSGQFLQSSGAGNPPVFAALPASAITLQGNSGGALGPAAAFTINGGTTGLTTSGSGTTLSLTGTLVTNNGGTGAAGTITGVVIGAGSGPMTGNAITNHFVLVGGASNAITSVDPSTSGFVLTSNGASDPSFQAIPLVPGFVIFTGPSLTIGSASSITWCTAGTPSSTVSTQNQAQFICPVAGTVRDLNIYIWANNSTSSATVTINKNSSHTSVVATIPALTTGSFSDITHSFTVVAGDLIQFEVQQTTVGAPSGAISCYIN